MTTQITRRIEQIEISEKCFHQKYLPSIQQILGNNIQTSDSFRTSNISFTFSNHHAKQCENLPLQYAKSSNQCQRNLLSRDPLDSKLLSERVLDVDILQSILSRNVQGAQKSPISHLSANYYSQTIPLLVDKNHENQTENSKKQHQNCNSVHKLDQNSRHQQEFHKSRTSSLRLNNNKQIQQSFSLSKKSRLLKSVASNLLKSLKENKNQLSMVIEEENEEAQCQSIVDNIDIDDLEDQIQIPKNSEKFCCGSLMTPSNRHLNNQNKSGFNIVMADKYQIESAEQKVDNSYKVSPLSHDGTGSSSVANKIVNRTDINIIKGSHPSLGQLKKNSFHSKREQL